MDSPTIPPSAIRQPPPPSPSSRRCSDSNNDVRWKTNIDSIPEELLFEILGRLPAEILHDIAMLVCRRWCHIIRSRAFITWCYIMAADVRRKTNIVSLTKIESLSDKVLMYIRVRLPADFLHDYVKCVCRRWCHLIRSHDFVKKQLQRSTFVLSFSSISESPSYFPHSLYMTDTESGQITRSKLRSIRGNQILASDNCLVVELRHVNAGSELFVINPATKQSFPLPSVSVGNRNVYYMQCGIAYSAASKEYKVTLPYDVDGQLACLEIVTVGVDKSWRHVEIPPLLEHFRSLLYSSPLSSEGGFLHWGKERDCLTLNVETEAFTMSEAPILCDQRCDECSYYYVSTGRYLTLLVGHRKNQLWEVWEMRPAESGEWRKAVLPNMDFEPPKVEASTTMC